MNNIRYKYPRTPHLPWSPGATSDDITLSNCVNFMGKEVFVSEKMDGECTSIYQDYSHARSTDGRYNNTQSLIRALQAQIGYLIPINWRICGENLFAKHSIFYNDLPDHFLAFSVWNKDNFCLNLSDTLSFLDNLGLKHPKILYQGIWDENAIKSIKLDFEKQEGYVVRTTEGFHYNEFNNNIAKYVRKNHVCTGKSWKTSKITQNNFRK